MLKSAAWCLGVAAVVVVALSGAAPSQEPQTQPASRPAALAPARRLAIGRARPRSWPS